jgi:hypothetical protein
MQQEDCHGPYTQLPKKTGTVCINAIIQDGNGIRIDNRLRLYKDRIVAMYHPLLAMLYSIGGGGYQQNM